MSVLLFVLFSALSRRALCRYLLCYRIHRQETEALRVMREMACFALHFVHNLRYLYALFDGLNQQQLARRTSLEIHALGLEIASMRTVLRREAILQQDNQRMTGFPKRSAYLLLAFRYGRRDENRTVSGFCQALVFSVLYLRRRQAARALKDSALRIVGEENIPQCAAQDTAKAGLSADAEKPRVGALHCEPVRVVLDIPRHVGQLMLARQQAVVVFGGEERGWRARGGSREV